MTFSGVFRIILKIYISLMILYITVFHNSTFIGTLSNLMEGISDNIVKESTLARSHIEVTEEYESKNYYYDDDLKLHEPYENAEKIEFRQFNDEYLFDDVPEYAMGKNDFDPYMEDDDTVNTVDTVDFDYSMEDQMIMVKNTGNPNNHKHLEASSFLPIKHNAKIPDVSDKDSFWYYIFNAFLNK